MSTECMEFVRLLSNLETDSRKLVQVILVGQPELREIVGSKRLRQLDQRIAVRHHLTPLDFEETRQYVRHRLQVAGSGTVIFPERGLRAIHRYSRGIPRLINLACDRVLLAAYANEELRISASRVKKALEDLRQDACARPVKAGRKHAGKSAVNLKPALAGFAVLTLLAMLAIIWLYIYGMA